MHASHMQIQIAQLPIWALVQCIETVSCQWSCQTRTLSKRSVINQCISKRCDICAKQQVCAIEEIRYFTVRRIQHSKLRIRKKIYIIVAQLIVHSTFEILSCNAVEFNGIDNIGSQNS